MPEDAITEIRPHEKVLHIAVLKRSLDEESTQKLVDDVLIAAGQRRGVPIVLDLTNLRFAPSVALGSLVQLTKSFQFEKRRILLIGIHERVRGAIRVTQLDRLLEIFTTLDEATRVC